MARISNQRHQPVCPHGRNHPMLRRWPTLFVVVLSFFACSLYGDQPSPEVAPAEGRLQLMKAALADWRVASTAIVAENKLKFADRALLRYSDQTRGLEDAAVWRLGETGRPIAVVTLEIYRSGPNANSLSYEFVSLTKEGFDMKSARGPKWSPTAGDLEMLPLADAPSPNATTRGRLTQFRQLAQRFSVSEKLPSGSIECRLLPQPIDRYSDADASIIDGAMFAFANGTNPELGLLLECSDKGWSYGAFRMSSAELTGALDGKTFFTAEAVNSLRAPFTAAYRASQQPLEQAPVQSAP
jgi:hypothetical protein